MSAALRVSCCRTERSGKLLDAEAATIAAGGTVVRLGGLYRCRGELS